MSAIVTKEEITHYIPQRIPFVMVDTMENQSTLHAVSTFHILPSNLLLENGYFTESGLLENIAQTAAANVGYECAKKNIPVPLGFIGAISKIKCHQLPAVNSTITTKITVLQEVFGITLIEGVAFENDTKLIECQMKIMIQNKPDEVR